MHLSSKRGGKQDIRPSKLVLCTCGDRSRLHSLSHTCFLDLSLSYFTLSIFPFFTRFAILLSRPSTRITLRHLISTPALPPALGSDWWRPKSSTHFTRHSVSLSIPPYTRFITCSSCVCLTTFLPRHDHPFLSYRLQLYHCLLYFLVCFHRLILASSLGALLCTSFCFLRCSPPSVRLYCTYGVVAVNFSTNSKSLPLNLLLLFCMHGMVLAV